MVFIRFFLDSILKDLQCFRVKNLWLLQKPAKIMHTSQNQTHSSGVLDSTLDASSISLIHKVNLLLYHFVIQAPVTLLTQHVRQVYMHQNMPTKPFVMVSAMLPQLEVVIYVSILMSHCSLLVLVYLVPMADVNLSTKQVFYC